MKRFVVVFLGLVLTAGFFPARAQVAPAAIGRRLVVNAGGEFSSFQPDFAGERYAQHTQDLYGIGAWVDADFTRWVQIEAEGRWLHWNKYASDIDQNTYMIGPRVPILDDFHGFTPYGKFLFGWGSGAFLTGRTTTWAYGGGVDYRLGRKFTVRCFDFEYQDWDVTPTLHPYGYSVGLSYKVF